MSHRRKNGRPRKKGPPRSGHTKSLDGCRTCKNRHIKSGNCTKRKTRCPYNDVLVSTESAGLSAATQLPGGIYHGNMLDRNVGGDDEGNEEGNENNGADSVISTCVLLRQGKEEEDENDGTAVKEKRARTDSVTSPRVGATRGAAMSHIIVPSGLATQTPSLPHSAPGMHLSDFSPSMDADPNDQHDTIRWSTFGLPATELGGFPSTMPQSPWDAHSPLRQTPGLHTYFAAATHQQQNSGAGLYTKQDPCPWVRKSCDRCHGQKTRCAGGQAGGVVEGSETSLAGPVAASEPCERCKKVGAICEYSAPRRCGRPRNRRDMPCAAESVPGHVDTLPLVTAPSGELGGHRAPGQQTPPAPSQWQNTSEIMGSYSWATRVPDFFVDVSTRRSQSPPRSADNKHSEVQCSPSQAVAREL